MNSNFAANIHHGIPLKQMEPIFRPRGDYLAFIGRISPENGQTARLLSPAV